MASGKTGGLNWHGVGKPSGAGQQTTRVDVLMNKSRASRQMQAMRAPRVGSAAIVSADDWLAAAAAHHEARERKGAVGNPFESVQALVKESKRQAAGKHDASEFDISDDADDPVWLSQDGWRSPGLYAGGCSHQPVDESPVAAQLQPERHALADSPRSDEQAPAAVDATLSRESKREIDLSVAELRDELEKDGRSKDTIDAQCDQLRANLLARALARVSNPSMLT